MQRKFVVSDSERCIGCQICEYVCSAVKEGGFNPLLSRIRTVRIEPAFNISMACRLCEDPTCVKSCPRNALSKDEKTGIIILDEEKCNGCAWCIETCEFGAIALHSVKKTIIVCDLCDGDPKCLPYCPTEALSLKTPEEISQKTRKKAIMPLMSRTSE
jgi:carbon-monoxide dehydrogenase iron sulfur subunit